MMLRNELLHQNVSIDKSLSASANRPGQHWQKANHIYKDIGFNYLKLELYRGIAFLPIEEEKHE